MSQRGTNGGPTALSDYRTGLERAGISIQPKTARPIEELRRAEYDTDTALEVFESLLLTAAGVDLTADLNSHPLVLTQAAKALVGLRPERPSQRLMEFALDTCQAQPATPRDPELLKVSAEELGLTVSVHEFESGIIAGDLEAAQKHAGRLLMVSDNKALLFDVLLEVAARHPETATGTIPFIHSAQRAMDFVGPRNLADFLLPALESVVRCNPGEQGMPDKGRSISPWEELPYLWDAPLEVVLLAAHAAQIEVDEHVKGAAIRNGLERSLAVLIEPLNKPLVPVGPKAGTVAELIQAARGGRAEEARAIGHHLGQKGERRWLLEVLEHMEESHLNPDLVLWADAFRMLYRTAPDEDYGMLGEVAGVQLIKGLKK